MGNANYTSVLRPTWAQHLILENANARGLQVDCVKMAGTTFLCILAQKYFLILE